MSFDNMSLAFLTLCLEMPFLGSTDRASEAPGLSARASWKVSQPVLQVPGDHKQPLIAAGLTAPAFSSLPDGCDHQSHLPGLKRWQTQWGRPSLGPWSWLW